MPPALYILGCTVAVGALIDESHGALIALAVTCGLLFLITIRP